MLKKGEMSMFDVQPTAQQISFILVVKRQKKLCSDQMKPPVHKT